MEFKDYTKEEQDLILLYMDIIIQEMITNRNHIPISHIAKVVQEFYDTFPGLYEYRLEELYKVAPDGNIFSTYMPDPGIEIKCVSIPDGCTYANAIDISIEEKNNEDS